MALQILFDPPVDDGFDDDRCLVIVDTGSFRGETRFRNRSPLELSKLAEELRRFPISDAVKFQAFDGLLKIRLEPRDELGHLRLQIWLAEEIDCNSVSIDANVTHSELQRFETELSNLISKNCGSANL
ncbi:hypothetical protein GRI34_04215 [Erythrobacter aquimaris]|uniref:Uncharacterized protein n=1 Tax=Qipengyuania aquimaris TaxID=255984 RepID=A0A6I4TIC6_9SPHN|nr:hypothetical protein [Qipengyuania aquimaris]MXO95624.1 hypothetical protein [Qipengyuania aquimaris]